MTLYSSHSSPGQRCWALARKVWPGLFGALLCLLALGCGDSHDVKTVNIFEPHYYGEWSPAPGAPTRCSADAPRAEIRAYHPDIGEVSSDEGQALRLKPLDEVTLKAGIVRDDAGRDAPTSTPARARWRIAQRPEGSTAPLPAEDSLETSLWMQLAGRYLVELEVWDEHDEPACGPARLVLEAIPDSDIHVQLVWHTPADPDETDQWGADMDIHLMHPNARGRWHHPVWDCHWRNPNPAWGRDGHPEDDPSLDIDDIDGAGPENINLDNPEDGATYQVGVHYFSDHDFGVSFATVRIYLGGELRFESAPLKMLHRERQLVAEIHWPSREITALVDVQ